MSDAEKASLRGKLGSASGLHAGGDIWNSGRDAGQTADETGDRECGRDAAQAGDQTSDRDGLSCFSSDDASGEGCPVSMGTDTGAGVDRLDVVRDDVSDVAGVFGSGHVCGKGCLVDESGSDVTGVFSSDDASREASLIDESGSDVSAVFSSDDASVEPFPGDETGRDPSDNGAEVRVEEKRGMSAEYCSGVDGDPNLREVRSCGTYQYPIQAWRRKQRGAGRSEICEEQVQSREQIGAGDGVSCHLLYKGLEKQSRSEAALFWRGGRLHVDGEQRGTVHSGIAQKRVQSENLTGAGDGVSWWLSHHRPVKRSMSEAGRRSGSCKEQVQLKCESADKDDDVSGDNQYDPCRKPQKGTKCKLLKECKVDEFGSDVTGMFSTGDPSGEACLVDESASDVTGVFSSDDSSVGASLLDDSGRESSDSGAEVIGEQQQRMSDKYRSGITGHPNMSNVGRCGSYQQPKQAWRRKQTGVAQSAISQEQVHN